MTADITPVVRPPAGLARVESQVGGDHVDLFTGGWRAGSVWPAVARRRGFTAVCSCGQWKATGRTEQDATDRLARHGATDHGGPA